MSYACRDDDDDDDDVFCPNLLVYSYILLFRPFQKNWYHSMLKWLLLFEVSFFQKLHSSIEVLVIFRWLFSHPKMSPLLMSSSNFLTELCASGHSPLRIPRPKIRGISFASQPPCCNSWIPILHTSKSRITLSLPTESVIQWQDEAWWLNDYGSRMFYCRWVIHLRCYPFNVFFIRNYL